MVNLIMIIMMSKNITKKGILYGVGVGPGDPDLITLKAIKAINAIEVIAYLIGDNGKSLARSIAADHIGDDKQEIAIPIPMLSDPKPAMAIYDEAAITIGNQLKNGHDVAMLCEGDPFFYGSFMYIYSRMIDEFKIKIIPGISSIMAASAATGVPLASRNDVMAVIPATLSEDKLSAKISVVDRAVFIKIGSNLEKIRRLLIKYGLIDRAIYIEYASMDKQKIMALNDVDGDVAPYFSLIIIK